MDALRYQKQPPCPRLGGCSKLAGCLLVHDMCCASPTAREEATSGNAVDLQVLEGLSAGSPFPEAGRLSSPAAGAAPVFRSRPPPNVPLVLLARVGLFAVLFTTQPSLYKEQACSTHHHPTFLFHQYHCVPLWRRVHAAPSVKASRCVHSRSEAIVRSSDSIELIVRGTI